MKNLFRNITPPPRLLTCVFAVAMMCQVNSCIRTSSESDSIIGTWYLVEVYENGAWHDQSSYPSFIVSFDKGGNCLQSVDGVTTSISYIYKNETGELIFFAGDGGFWKVTTLTSSFLELEGERFHNGIILRFIKGPDKLSSEERAGNHDCDESSIFGYRQ